MLGLHMGASLSQFGLTVVDHPHVGLRRKVVFGSNFDFHRDIIGVNLDTEDVLLTGGTTSDELLNH